MAGYFCFRKKHKHKAMKKYFVLFVALSCISYLNAVAGDEIKTNNNSKLNTCISGKVMDKISGEALTGAMVKIDGTQLTAYTDFEGNFSFTGLVPGKYSVSTSLISYQAITISSIEVHENEVHSLNLDLKSAN